MSRQGRWRGNGVSSQGPPAPRPSSHSKKLTWHAETETSRYVGSAPYFSHLLSWCSPSSKPLLLLLPLLLVR